MKKITAVLPGIAICVWGADFWQTKPYTEWNDKDIQKIETNSPWSKQVPVSLGEPMSGGGSGKGNRRSGSTSEIDSSGSGLSGGGNANRNAGLQDVGGSAIAGGGAGLTLTVSWRTALPLRQAVAKEKFGAEAATSADAKKLIEEQQKFYAIMVSGLPGRALRGGDKMKETLIQNTSLIVKGRDPVAASDVQVGGNEQRALIIFLFPRTSPISLDDKDVEFATKLGPISVRQKFHLKDMVFQGKLDL